ncbi:MAG: thioredoxin [Clostridia bacterium]|nr:thioredoxin [Clostridia bacterium]MBN2883403.1 thioredoxin [Clostridia bacterium]
MFHRKAASIAVIIIAIAMVVFGIYRTEVSDVFNKAIRICLECIGIGWLPW